MPWPSRLKSEMTSRGDRSVESKPAQRRPLIERLRPEYAAGGYSRYDGTSEFFVRINTLLRPEMSILDFGAGRGRGLAINRSSPFRYSLLCMKGKVARVVGVDVDPAVLQNRGLDEAHVVGPNEPLPFAPNTFDLVICDHVLEHIADPAFFAAEMERLIRPGGWLCARTPHRWGYIGIATNLIPNRWHKAVLRKVQEERKEEDVFPTLYRLNTYRALRRHFPLAKWGHHSYGWSSEPGYHGENLILWRLIELYNNLMPPNLAAKIHVFLQRRPQN